MLSGNFSATTWHDIPGLGKAAALKTAALHLQLLGWAFGCGCEPGYLVQIYTAFGKGPDCNSLRQTRLCIVWDLGRAAGGGMDAVGGKSRMLSLA